MNIFPTDPCPHTSAMALDDKRVVRQASEVVLMLAGAQALLGESSFYKPFQPAHPLMHWLLKPRNWWWASEYARSCNVLYTTIYGRVCVCWETLEQMRKLRHELPTPTKFCNMASNRSLGLCFKHVEDPHEAYRKYLQARWDRDRFMPVWSDRLPPVWS